MADPDPPPSAKRRRLSEKRPARGGTREGKRALAPDAACSPAKRSRRSANMMAKELLASGAAIGDDKVLRVLRRWEFSKNESRANVIPSDATFVFSDTLGLVSSRTGGVFVSRITKRYPAVFELLSSWVRQAWPLSPRFPFTSISLNFNYAARVHRDSNNAGPLPLFVIRRR